jgi:hypothetical protein
MEEPVNETIRKHFGTIREPRLERTRLYELMEILVIAICAVICGADKEKWLRSILELPNGIPSHDTCGYLG